MQKHPDLFKKLKLLHDLGANPDVRSNSGLARKIGVSRQAVSRWCRGHETSRGDKIPEYILASVCNLYDVESEWFALLYEEFAEIVKKKLADEKEGPVTPSQQISVSALPITSLEIFGRDNELALLNELWTKRKTNVVQIVGFGGLGKTTIINKWLSKLSEKNYQGANRVYAWSFYWQGHSSEVGTSGDFFIGHALNWFGDKKPGEGSAWAKANRLVQYLRSFKSILVLDGLEPLQHKPGSKTGEIENPAVSTLIRELATYNPGLCVITSRLPVADLAPYMDSRVRTMELKNLSLSASKEVLKHYGVAGSERDFDAAVKRYKGHPLSLSLLGGYISVAYRGEIKNFRKLKSLLNEKKLGSHAKNIIRAYLDWFKGREELELLYLVALFDRAVSLSSLQAIVAAEDVDNLTKNLRVTELEDWLYSIELLAQANLISRFEENGDKYFDCHPIVRDFIEHSLKRGNKELWRKGHELIFAHLQSSLEGDSKLLPSREPLFRAVIHGAKSERYQEAFAMYHDQIKHGYTMLSSGSHDADYACIRAFFDQTDRVPTHELSEPQRFYLMASYAANLMSLGRLHESLTPAIECIEYYKSSGMWLEATHAAGPLISALIAAGELSKAVNLVDSLEDCVANTENDVILAMSKNFKAYILYLKGQNQKAEKLFHDVEKVLLRSDPRAEVSFPTISSYYCKFLLETGQEIRALERGLKTMGWRREKTWQVRLDTTSVHASDLLILGLTYLEIGDKPNAKKYLNKQVELFRSAGEWLYLPAGLTGRAKYHVAVSDFESANKDLQEALDLSTRTRAVFSQWEANLELANLYCTAGNYHLAADHMKAANSLPGMNDYKFRDAKIRKLEALIEKNL